MIKVGNPASNCDMNLHPYTPYYDKCLGCKHDVNYSILSLYRKVIAVAKCVKRKTINLIIKSKGYCHLIKLNI